MMLRAWRERRTAADCAAVLAALEKLHPDYASGLYISRVGCIGIGRVHPALVRLEQDGKLQSRWVDIAGSHRRRVYERNR